MNKKDWNKIAKNYYKEIISPIKDAEKDNPLEKDLKKIKKTEKTAIDLGCGTGPLLPKLSKKYEIVYGVDFSEGMIKKAKKRKLKNVTIEKANLKNLEKYENKFDTCFAINSILAKDIKSINKIINEIYKTLKPGGKIYAVLPSMESYLYQFMLIIDKELEKGVSQKKAKKKALDPFYDDDFDFVQGLTNFQKQTQKSLYRFEIRYRFKKQGFKNIKIQRINYKWKAWEEAGQLYFPEEEPPWDWYLTCKKPLTTKKLSNNNKNTHK